MTTKIQPTEDYTGREFTITRTFDAPRELVFQAWTDPKHLAEWWGPRGFTNPVCEWDVRPGGKIYDVMRAPNGDEYPMGGEFREITPPERVVFMCGPVDGKGAFVFEFLHTAVFTAQGQKTLLTLKSRVLKITPEANRYIGGFEAGMTQSLEKLTDWLAEQTAPLVVERVYEAPIGLVWRALTEPDKLSQWSHDMIGFKPEVGCHFEFYGEKDGVKYLHHCVITELVPQRKLTHTWCYEGHEGASVVSFELFAEDGKTRLKLTHTGLETFRMFARSDFNQGWTHLIGSSLKEHVENPTADREFVVSRVVDAPRELVWDAMTVPEHVARWWGPRGFSVTIEKMDFRVGGTWKQAMHGPDGANYLNEHVFMEIVKPERIVMSHGGKKEGGSPVRFTATWTFETVEETRTKVSIRMVFPSAEECDRVVREFGAIEGGKQTLERLSEEMTKQPIVIERQFNAPMDSVWQAITDPQQIRQWFMPELEAFKPEPGFETTFTHACGDGGDHVHHWKVTEVVPGRKIAYAWRWEGVPGESILSMELFPENARTRLKLVHSGLETYQPRANPKMGRGNFAKGWAHYTGALGAFLEKGASPDDRAVIISRVFGAPRELLWRAWTDPKHLAQWWGPKDFTNPVCEMDVQPGGAWRVVMRGPDGAEYPLKSVYVKVDPMEKLVLVMDCSDHPVEWHDLVNPARDKTQPPKLECVQTITFEDVAGGTKLTIRTDLETRLIRDSMVKMGMHDGWSESLDRLAESLLQTA